MCFMWVFIHKESEVRVGWRGEGGGEGLPKFTLVSRGAGFGSGSQIPDSGAELLTTSIRRDRLAGPT